MVGKELLLGYTWQRGEAGGVALVFRGKIQNISANKK
jgi:hypothetical protein